MSLRHDCACFCSERRFSSSFQVQNIFQVQIFKRSARVLCNLAEYREFDVKWGIVLPKKLVNMCCAGLDGILGLEQKKGAVRVAVNSRCIRHVWKPTGIKV